MAQHIRHSILLIRLSSIGDIIMASGLPKNIKEAYPDANVVWLVEAPYRSLIEHHDYVDDVICWPKQHWQSLLKQKKVGVLLREINAFKRQLRQHNFSIAIDAQGLIKSAFLAWLSGAKLKIGFRSKEKSHWLLNQVHQKVITPVISSEYESLGKQLGGAEYHLQIDIPKDQLQAADAMLKQNKISNYIVVCPFTTRPQKHWPASYWYELIERIHTELNVSVIVLGASSDRAYAQRFSDIAPSVFNFAGQTNLLVSAALIQNARLIIGVDTGMTHLATVFKRKTIALFGSTVPYLDAKVDTTTIFYKSLSCSPCKRHPTCDGQYECMSSISPSDVMHQTRLYQ